MGTVSGRDGRGGRGGCDEDSAPGPGPRPGGDCRRIGVVGVVVGRREETAGKVQEILSQYADLIVGRMGIPYRERGVSVIALIVDGDTDRLGALTGRLGALPGVYVRSALTAYSDEDG